AMVAVITNVTLCQHSKCTLEAVAGVQGDIVTERNTDTATYLSRQRKACVIDMIVAVAVIHCNVNICHGHANAESGVGLETSDVKITPDVSHDERQIYVAGCRLSITVLVGII